MENDTSYGDQCRENENAHLVNMALVKKELKEMRLEMLMGGYPLWTKYEVHVQP